MAQRHDRGCGVPGLRARSSRSRSSGCRASPRSRATSTPTASTCARWPTAAHYAYGLNDGRFFITGAPMQGVNPPKVAGPPPLKPDTPVRDPAAAGPAHARAGAAEGDQGQPERARRRAASARGRAKAVRWLKRTLKSQGSKLRVLDEPLLRADLAASTGARSDEARDPRARQGLHRDRRPDRGGARRLLRDPAKPAAADPAARGVAVRDRGRVRRPARPSRRARGRPSALSGVRVGDIAKVRLRGGRAIITMELDRRYKGLVTARLDGLLRPKTGLKDMFIELTPGEPGAPALPEGGTLPIAVDAARRQPGRVPLLARRRHARLPQAAAQRRAQRASRAAPRTCAPCSSASSRPTATSARSSTRSAKRRGDLERLVNALQRLNGELGRSDDDLAELVTASARVFDAFAKERVNVAATVRELPVDAAPGHATRSAASRRWPRSWARPPSACARSARALRRANVATRPFALEAAPLLRDDIRPFVRAARPLVRELRPAARRPRRRRARAQALGARAQPPVQHARLQPERPRGPADKADRDEGYLFYFAWLAHQCVTLFGGTDAHGVVPPARARRHLQHDPQLGASRSPAARSWLGVDGDPLRRERLRRRRPDEQGSPEPARRSSRWRRSRCRASGCCCSCG